MAKLKLEDQKIATTFLEAEIETKIRTARNNLILAQEQYKINDACHSGPSAVSAARVSAIL